MSQLRLHIQSNSTAKDVAIKTRKELKRNEENLLFGGSFTQLKSKESPFIYVYSHNYKKTCFLGPKLKQQQI